MKDNKIPERKAQHIDIVLQKNVQGRGVTTGLETYRFIHHALPELDFQEIDTSTTFLSKNLQTPFLVSSMTGGTDISSSINRNLAMAAEEKGWGFALGSSRAALESPKTAYTFQVRKYAPSIPIIANLGAVQLNYGYGVEECKKILEITEADALVLHLNSLQEVFQNEGNVNFKNLIQKIEKICRELNAPVGIKEVGWGINGSLSKRLMDLGVAFIDVAGAGGTSWSQVEKYRSIDPVKKLVADAFIDWGIPTADCILDSRINGYEGVLVASGGIQTGVDAAKAIALGANMVGFGRTILKDALNSKETLITAFERIELELKIAMFGAGAGTIQELTTNSRLKKQPSHQ